MDCVNSFNLDQSRPLDGLVGLLGALAEACARCGGGLSWSIVVCVESGCGIVMDALGMWRMIVREQGFRGMLRCEEGMGVAYGDTKIGSRGRMLGEKRREEKRREEERVT